MNSEDDPLKYKFFKLAKNVSKHSKYRLPVGAVIVRKNSVISVGFNKKKSHPKYANPNTTIKGCIHAEVSAIITSGNDVSGCDVYVYRQDRNGNIALSRPCNNCYSVLKEHGIRRMYFSVPEKPYFKMEKL